MQVESVRHQAELFEHNINSAPLNAGDKNTKRGCGLPFVAKKIKEHYNNHDQRANNISVRLIGEQAIALAKHFYRLVDALEILDESPAEKIKRQALGKAGQHLRNAGTLFNKIDTDLIEIGQLQQNLTIYFNLLSLFFNSSVNVTVWTMAYAIPYHAVLLYNQYSIGYGIISLQAKESKHSCIKHDLKLTNRSRSTGSVGKWWQVMRANYVRAFYLPEHNPMPSMYVSHYESRMPSQVCNPLHCECGRKKPDLGEQLCRFCEDCSMVLECSSKQQLTPDVHSILKPITCGVCSKRFPDIPSRDRHHNMVHCQDLQIFNINAKQLSVAQLKEELRRRQLSTTGNKNILVSRLEGRLASEV